MLRKAFDGEVYYWYDDGKPDRRPASPNKGGKKTQCPDCVEAARLAYSDATTPGFFNPKCARHQEQKTKQS